MPRRHNYDLWLQYQQLFDEGLLLRLTPEQHRAILECGHELFGHATIRLFGSRLDNTQRGGDIDLYIQTDDTSDLVRKKVLFLSKLKRQIGEQKIDILFDTGKDRPIDRIAKTQGVVL